MGAVLELDDAGILRIVEQLRVAYKLKITPRYGAQRDPAVHSESVAEHKWALAYLARYFVRVEVLPRRLNMEKVDDLITFHDFGEIPKGDKPYKFKTKEDEAQEHLDALEVFSQLPAEIRGLAQTSWEEYLAKKTLEGQFVNALDKLEPCFELQGSYESTLRRLGYTYHDHADKKLAATANFPVMHRFVVVTIADKLKRGVFADQLALGETT